MSMSGGHSTKTAGRLGLLVALVVSLTTATPICVTAQVVGATLSGTVADQSGAVIPNVQISIKNIATAVTRVVMTDSAGFYTAPNLLPATYEITVTASGFATAVQTGITLNVGAQQSLNVTLHVGQAAMEKVQVIGEAPEVQLTTSSISAEVSSTTVRELPLNGRSWTDLATLQPGVVASQVQFDFTGGSGRATRGYGNQISISGARPQQNNYRLDGISLNDHSNSAGSVIGGNLGVDAIQEFSVLTTNYPAEYGRTAGGVVNAITRSGTNQFHGDAYEFLRNSALDARNFFDLGSIPAFKRNQFGVAAGGPIWKEHTFVFGDYEGIRQSKGITNLAVVPSAAAQAGNLCSIPGTPPACTPTTVNVDPSVQKYLTFYHVPNAGLVPGANGDTGFYSFVGKQVVTENFLTTRMDHHFSEKDSISGSWMHDKALFTQPDSLNDVLLSDSTARNLISLEETHIFNPTLINTVRLGYSRAAVDADTGFTAINPAAKDSSLAAVPGFFATRINPFSGVTSFTGGLGSDTPLTFIWNSFQFYDDAFKTSGSQSLKFGVGVERMQLNTNGANEPAGLFIFSSLPDFLTNHPSRYTGTITLPGTSAERGYRQTLFGGYIQDDWRWRPNLTLNLGLRYEMTTALTEVKGLLAELSNITDPKPRLGNPVFSHNPTLRNFEPRVGFAWDPFHNAKTAVRGAFGLYDVLPLPYQYAQKEPQSAPFSVTSFVNQLPPGSFYTGALNLQVPGSLLVTYVEQNPHRSYVMQWNLNVQHELTPSLTAMVGYVGSRGRHLPFRVDDVDIVLPTLTSAGYLWPSPVGSGKTLNPNFGQICALYYKATSAYDALQLEIVKRMSHGLQLQTSYTWGKSIDTSSASVAGDTNSNGISSPYAFDARLTRGPSDYNIGRILVINGIWQVPGVTSRSEPVSRLVNGWQLGAIYKAEDGTPFTPTFGTDGDPLGLNNSDPWDFPNRLTSPGCSSLINPGNPNNYIKTQCFAIPTAPSLAFYQANCDPSHAFPQCFNLRGNAGRNILIGPGTSLLDFSVFKNNYIRRISESFNIQFRTEFFNIFNHPNFAMPSSPSNDQIFLPSGASSSTAGLLTSTNTTSREIQFGLKIIW
jgi:hypothetical protein